MRIIPMLVRKLCIMNAWMITYCFTNLRNNGVCYSPTPGTYACNCPCGYTGYNCQNRVYFCNQNTTYCNAGTCQESQPCSVSLKKLKHFYFFFCFILLKINFRLVVNVQLVTTDRFVNIKLTYVKFMWIKISNIKITKIFIFSQPCIPNPCSTNAVCQKSTTSVTSFTCSCNPGYYGIYCESVVNSCQSNPCRNGTCVSSLLTYRCV